MARNNVALLAFNRGIISPLALSRVDLDRLSLSAEIQKNWMPRSLGSMMLRPGFGFIGTTKDNKQSRLVEFVFATNDTALLEFTDGYMRVWVDDNLVRRDSVSSTITNGDFSTDLSGWEDADGNNSISEWVEQGLQLTGNGSTSAVRRQLISVSEADKGKKFGLNISIASGSARLNIGSSKGTSDYFSANLGEGEHSISFTPNDSFYIEFKSSLTYPVVVESVSITSGGIVELKSPYAEINLQNIQFTQSADVLFIACDGLPPYRLERRNNNSWSIIKYQPENGPFNVINTSSLSIKPSAISGKINLTSSGDLFDSAMTGSLFRIESSGQTVRSTITGESQFTNYIKVIGRDDARKFTITRSNVDSATPFSGKITLQRSVGSPGAWTDVKTWNGTGTETYNDDLANNTIYYRIGVGGGDFGESSGDITLSLEYSGGSLTGIVRIISVESFTSATAVVLSDLGNTDATTNWYQGAWSRYDGFPNSVSIYEGRLWWAGSDRIWGSYSDSYNSFDDGLNSEDIDATDASAIDTTIGYGPVDKINWMMPLLRLIVGTQGSEASVQSSSFSEVLTPTNFHIKYPSTRGSKNTGCAILDTRGLFVHRGGTRVFELSYDSGFYDYTSNDLTILCPEIGEAGINRIKGQRMPDDRIHCVRNDGTVALLVTDPAEDVQCWIEIETQGKIEDVACLPGGDEDNVYYIVDRDGYRCIEKWARENECIGGDITKLADSFVYYNVASTLSGLSHLSNKEVVIWADGEDLGVFTVSASGSIELPKTYNHIIVGLGYTAKYQSSKLAYSANMGTALNQIKKVHALGVILRNTHIKGLRYGTDFNHLDYMPRMEGEDIMNKDHIYKDYDEPMFIFDGRFSTDSRLCLEAKAPKPVTILSAVIGMQTHDRT